MDQKLFLEKLTEVADWHWENYAGATYASKSSRWDHNGDNPQYPHLDRVKPRPCPHNAEPIRYLNGKKKPAQCEWRCEIKSHEDQKVLIQRCNNCGGLMSQKGIFIPKPDHYRYAEIILRTDKEAK
jgi:hypothetical protein